MNKRGSAVIPQDIVAEVKQASQRTKVVEPEQVQSIKRIRKTYLLRPETHPRIIELQKKLQLEDLGLLADFLINASIEAIEDGSLEIPVEQQTVHQIKR